MSKGQDAPKHEGRRAHLVAEKKEAGMNRSFWSLILCQLIASAAGFAFLQPIRRFGHRTITRSYAHDANPQHELYHLYLPDGDVFVQERDYQANGQAEPGASEFHLYLPEGEADVGGPKGGELDALETFTVTHSISHVVEKNRPVSKTLAIKHLYRYFTDICVDCWLATVDPEAFLLSCNYTKTDIADMAKEFPRILSLDVKSHLSPHVRFITRTLGGGQGDICSGEEQCVIDAGDELVEHDGLDFIPHNCKVSFLGKVVPPIFFGRRLEKTIAPRHAYLVYCGLPHGKELLENGGHLFREFLETCDTPTSNFARLCNSWSIKSRRIGAPTYEALHTTTEVESFERAFHRGLLTSAANKQSPELDLLGCTPGKMVDLLLQHGANAIEHDRFGSSMLHWAGGTGNLQGAKGLLSSLVEAGEGEDAAEVLLNTQGAKGELPIHWAACGVDNARFGVGGHVNTCRLFLEEAGERAGELANAVCYDGSTPLMWAAWSGSLDVVKLLVEHGADPHKKNRNDCNIAHWAAAGGNLRLCQYLKEELNVCFEEESIKCRKPMRHAISYGHHDVAEWLSSHFEDDDSWTNEKMQISPEIVANGTIPNLQ